MAKISTYTIDSTPQLSDKAFGTSIAGPPDNNTANFTLSSILGLFLPEIINNVYDNEIHVSTADGNDTTGTGSLLNPFATISKGLTLVSGQRKTIIIHPGSYTESPSITVQFTVLVAAGTSGVIGGNVLISGTVTTSTGCTISGLKMTALTINGVTGRGNINILNCDISGTLSKSGTADYTLVRFCDIGALNITSTSGTLAVFGGNPSFITINSIGASILVKNAVCLSPVVLVGGASFADCIIFAIGLTSNAITSSPGTSVIIANSQALIPSVSASVPVPARVSLRGFYSIVNSVFDKPNSTLIALSGTGGSTNSIVYSQFINADKFIKQGGLPTEFLKADGSSVTNVNASSVNAYGLTAVSSNGIAAYFEIGEANINPIAEFSKDGNTQAYITHDGKVFANAFAKIGASPQEFLKADGSSTTIVNASSVNGYGLTAVSINAVAAYFDIGSANTNNIVEFSKDGETVAYITHDGVVFSQRLLVNTTVIENSAQAQIDSTTKGFLPPRMTTTQINAIATPVSGLVVYNTTLQVLCFRDSTGWRKVTYTTM